jgi:hypothetical protein
MASIAPIDIGFIDYLAYGTILYVFFFRYKSHRCSLGGCAASTAYALEWSYWYLELEGRARTASALQPAESVRHWKTSATGIGLRCTIPRAQSVCRVKQKQKKGLELQHLITPQSTALQTQQYFTSPATMSCGPFAFVRPSASTRRTPMMSSLVGQKGDTL